MAYQVTLRVTLEVRDAEGRYALGFPEKTWNWTPTAPSGATPSPSVFPPEAETIRIPASTSRTLTVPNGVRYVLILPGEFADLLLRDSGDSATVITMTPSTNPIPAPIMFPLYQTSTTSFILKNNNASAQNLRVFWL